MRSHTTSHRLFVSIPQTLPVMTISINHLPPEVLGGIFVYANTYDLALRDHELENDFNWKALKPSHVCRYWRRTALNTPRMWTEITVGRGRLFSNHSKPGNARLVAA